MFMWIRLRRVVWTAAVTGVMASGAVAAPMGFKDSTMLMLDADKDEREISVNHAFTARDALGVSAHDMRMHTVLHGQRYSAWQQVRQLTYTRRAHRWNLPDAQANVWLFGGVGEVKRPVGHGSLTQTVLTPGFQVDHETTRVYSALMGRFHHADGFRQQTWVARGGFSFYETDYNEVQPWFILEAKHVSSLTHGVDWTPMLRFIHKRYFLEIGVTESGQARCSVMLNF